MPVLKIRMSPDTDSGHHLEDERALEFRSRTNQLTDGTRFGHRAIPMRSCPAWVQEPGSSIVPCDAQGPGLLRV